jgi:hypothetical protein
MAPVLQSPDKLSQSVKTTASRRPTSEIDREKRHSATNQFTVPMPADQHRDPSPSAEQGHHQEPAVPESKDHRFLISPFDKLFSDVKVDLLNPHGETKKMDQSIGEEGEDGKKNPLPQPIEERSLSLAHFVFSLASWPAYQLDWFPLKNADSALWTQFLTRSKPSLVGCQWSVVRRKSKCNQYVGTQMSRILR